VPCKALYNQIQHHPRIYCRRVGEQYSTLRCNKCKHDTEKVYYWKEIETPEGDIKMVKALIYGLRRCMNNECRILWDRDLNASINIREVTVALVKKEERPKYLCKSWKLACKKKDKKTNKTAIVANQK